MNSIAMIRNSMPGKELACDHQGLLLERGFSSWDVGNAEKRGKEIAGHIRQVSNLPVSEAYIQAFQRWRQLHQDNEFSQLWFGQLDNSRLMLGLGEASSIEAAITLHHTYGAPFIPGSAIKGMMRAYARDQNVTDEVRAFMFGKDASVEGDGGEAGYLIFHDAWWVPQSSATPLTPEIVTVHHAEYYKGEGAEATDFDSPNPNNQIAARGSFLFIIEGKGSLVAWAMALLTQALQTQGIGAKSCAGYGYFVEDVELNDELADVEEKLRRKITRLKAKELVEMFSKKRNVTKKQYAHCWELLVSLVSEIHSDKIRLWEHSSKSNERKAFDVLSG